MTDFQGRSLGVLGRIYDFVGGTRGVSRFDLAGSIQPVHDLSRESELGARGEATAGFLSFGQTLVHAGADAQLASSDLYALFDSVGVINDFSSTGQRKDRLWFLDIFGTTTGSIGSVDSGLELVIPAERHKLLAKWDVAGTAPDGGTELPLMLSDDGASLRVEPRMNLRPTPLLLGTLWNTRSASTGASTTRVHMLLWAGPLGTTPPGMR